MALFLSVYVISVVGALIHLYFQRKKRILETFLLYQIVFSLGVTSLLAFFGYTFLDNTIAEMSQWPACPFQQQVGNVNLAFATLGILSIWLRGLFWVATILGFSVWILGDGIQHLYHLTAFGNTSPGNAGVPLYTDFIVPIILLILLAFYCRKSLNVRY